MTAEPVTEPEPATCRVCGATPPYGTRFHGDPPDECRFSSVDVMYRTGVTYRRLDYWTRKGHVTPPTPTPGSGYPRRWRHEDVERVRLLAALTYAGLTLEDAVQWIDEESKTLVVETPVGTLRLEWSLDDQPS